MSENGSASAVICVMSTPAVAASASMPGREVLTHMGDTVGHQGTILALQQHHVGDGAQRGDLGVAPPEVGLAQAVPQHVDKLERHARTGELPRGAVWPELGVGHGDANGHEVARLVVVGDDHVDALRQEPLHLVRCGDAVVDRHHERGVAPLDDPGQSLLREAVTLAKAIWNEGVCVPAKVAQAQGEQTGGAHSVHVEIAKDRHGLAMLDGELKAVGGFAHTGNEHGVVPVALQRG